MTTSQKVRQIVINTSSKISEEVADNFKLKIEADALNLISEIVYKKLEAYGEDLEAFQKHAKRQQANIDDVKLLVRRNESLKEYVAERARDLSENQPAESTSLRKGKRKANN